MIKITLPQTTDGLAGSRTPPPPPVGLMVCPTGPLVGALSLPPPIPPFAARDGICDGYTSRWRGPVLAGTGATRPPRQWVGGVPSHWVCLARAVQGSPRCPVVL